jgi:long-chain acyl-CoA synthetase
MQVAEFFRRLAAHPSDATAVVEPGRAAAPAHCSHDLSYGELLDRVEAQAKRLRADQVRILATRLDNGIDWILADLAALLAGIVHVPIPHFFSRAQQRHVLQTAGADAILSRPDSPGAAAGPAAPEFMRIDRIPATLPRSTAKVTFTSGSTGTPKGVCLDAATMLAVAEGIASATSALPIERHMCALPLPILLENIAGLLAPLLRGAAVVAPTLDAVGLSGSSRFDATRLDAAIRSTDCASVVLLPQMLRSWTAWLTAAGIPAPPRLLLAAVGGASVGAAAIAAARAAGLPAYEGYGLSEGASVQTLNLPGADRPGSAGRPLPHARVRIAADGEIEIGGALFLGYLGEPRTATPSGTEPAGAASGWWRTGDLGTIDADGFVQVFGRKDALLVTGYGRNVSPEWVETTLHSAGGIAQAVVIGSGRPALGAVLWPTREAATDDELAAAVERANGHLPDYARIGSWVRSRHRIDDASIATANGRARRGAIATAYAHELFDVNESRCGAST